MGVELDKITFGKRTQRIYNAWRDAAQNDEYASIADTDALLLIAGDPAPEDEPARKGTAVQQWLLGYEFPSTLMLFTPDKIFILCSASKAKILAQIQGAAGSIPVELIAQAKAKEAPNDAVPRFFALYASKKRVGTLTKETHRGKLIDEWKKLSDEAAEKPELVDMAPALSAFMAVKDAEELKSIQLAGILTSTLLKYYVADRLGTILDKESKITHEVLAAQIEARLGSGEGDNAKPPDAKVWSKAKGVSPKEIDWPLVEFCYPPIIISRSSASGYDLRYTAESSSDNIAHSGVLLVAFGIRYKSYCTNVGRTFIVDPAPEQEAQYNLLLDLQHELLSKIKDGLAVREAYEAAVSFVKEKKPELDGKLQKNIGFVTGIEFRDAPYLLNAKSDKILKTDMVLSLNLGFQDLVDSRGKKYALQLVDTIKVEDDKSTMITNGTSAIKDTMFFLTQDSEEEVEVQPKKKAPVAPRKNGSPAKKMAGGKVLRNQPRRTQDEVHQSVAAKLIEHQRELHHSIQERGLAKYSEEGVGTEGKEGKGWKKFQSYKGEAGLPNEVEKLRIYVDRKSQTVILPMHGFAVPFHINTIKNASKNEEGDFVYIRINFQTPGQLTGKKEDTPFENPDATFIRSVVFRSSDMNRFDNVYRQITELKKEANKREQNKKEMADVVEQDKLIEQKARRPSKLPDAFIRPALDGKRLAGEVEIHQNGVRYVSPNGQKVDVLFNNVKHLFFQPCDHELLAIIHFHLKAPIMIGKKKTHDVQFVREATDAQFDETGNRKRKHRYGDEDEIEQEHQERKRRQALNKEMEAYSAKISEAAAGPASGEQLDVDVPYRDLSFEGVPHRTSVRLQPTTECLIHLTDAPFLVVTLSEIEIASLERVQYNLKHFDLVFVMKDFTKAPLHINSIPSSSMDDVKSWLDSVDIPMAESQINYHWGPLMKTINEDPHGFFQGGGWAFLARPAGVGSDRDEDSSDPESEFGADSEDMMDQESTDDESAYGDSGGSDESGSDFGDGSDESGDDWDELERKALKSDQKRADNPKRRGGSDSESDSPKKKKPAPKAGKSNGKTNGKQPVKGKKR
ncbi:FACT complex subunit SPT16 [Mycena kentingensis (nom. inval.)]|nr:FACT complex subunit SPT16 [Mycena kentingensis (nom. inval.)]